MNYLVAAVIFLFLSFFFSAVGLWIKGEEEEGD